GHVTGVQTCALPISLWHGTPSWLLLFGKIVIAFLVVIVLILLYYFGYQFLAPYGTIVWIVIAAIIVWQLFAVFIALARIRTTLYTVSNQRWNIATRTSSTSV